MWKINGGSAVFVTLLFAELLFGLRSYVMIGTAKAGDLNTWFVYCNEIKLLLLP